MAFNIFGGKKEQSQENEPQNNGRMVRPMETGDIEAVLAIIESHDDEDAQEASEEFAESVEGMYVAVDNGRIVGVTGSFTDGEADDIHWLSWTYVAEDQRRQGIGRYLVGGMFDQLQNMGARKVFITTGDYVEDGVDIYAGARAFYENLGASLELKMSHYFSQDEARYIFGLNITGQPEAVPVSIEQNGHLIFDGLHAAPESEDGLFLTWTEYDPETDTDANPKEKLEALLQEARDNKMRFLVAAIPADLSEGAAKGLEAMGFSLIGELQNLYDANISQQHWFLKL